MAKTAGGVRQTRPKSVAARAKDKIMMGCPTSGGRDSHGYPRSK